MQRQPWAAVRKVGVSNECPTAAWGLYCTMRLFFVMNMAAWKKYIIIGLITLVLFLVAIQAVGQGQSAMKPSLMVDAEKWVKAVEKAFGAPMDSTQQDSAKQIMSAFSQYGDGDYRKLAYILATAWHESKLRPIREIRARRGTPLYEQQNRYWPSGYYGRGFVQLTWESNYRKMGDFLGVDLVGSPDKALQPEYAARIIVYGMMNGSFTGKKLSQYIGLLKKDYYNARRVVNSTDRATQIKSFAEKLENEVV